MTHRHIETITFGTCLVICGHTHAHTYARTHFDIGTGIVGLPSLQALVGGGASLLSSHIFQGGLRNYLGGGWTQGSWRVFFSLFHMWSFININVSVNIQL